MSLKQLPLFILLAISCTPFFSGILSAQLNFEYDINQIEARTNIRECITVDGVMYFLSNDGYFGEELWQFDLATEQVKRLTDLRKLGGNSTPTFLTAYDNKVFFRAETDDRYVQLFYYDPANGLVKQATPFNFEEYDVHSLVVFEGKLWFTAKWQGRVNLWSYSAATGVFEEITPPDFGHPINFEPYYMAGHNGELYGTFNDTAQNRLVFRYNTNTGLFTHVPTQFDENTNNFTISKFTSCSGNLLMLIYQFPMSRWHYYDDSADSCIVLHGNNANVFRSTACVEEKFWFVDLLSGFVFDANTKQTQLLSTATADAPSNTSDIRELNGELYCNGNSSTLITAIFKLNKATQTWEYQPYFNIPDPDVKPDLRTINQYQEHQFAVSDRFTDQEIYKYTPDANSGVRLTDIRQGTANGSTYTLPYKFGNTMLFNGLDSTIYRMWQKDLSTNEYSLFSIQPPNGNWQLTLHAAAKVNNRLYFSGAKKGNSYIQMLSYAEGDDSLTVHGNTGNINNIHPWARNLAWMAPHNNNIYLVSPIEQGSYDSLRIFKFDTQTGYFSLLPGAEHLHNAKELTIHEGKLYFLTQNRVNGFIKDQLWVHDLAGNLTEIPLGNLSFIRDLVFLGGKLFFKCQNAVTPSETHFPIGTYNPNTGLVDTIHIAGSFYSEMSKHTIFQGKTWMFSRFHPDTLYTLNPLTAQINVALDLVPFGVKVSGSLVEFNGKLYFQGYTLAEGRELWEYDPGTGNVRLYADINPGGGHGNIENFKVIDNRLYFVANDGWRGDELWSISTCFDLTLNTIPDTNGLQIGKIEAITQGGTPPFSYAWNNGDTTASINDLDAGFYEVTVQDASGCQAVQFTVLCGVVSIDDVFEKIALIIFPNPAQNIIYIETTGNLPPAFQKAQLISPTGQIMREILLSDQTNLMDIGDLPNGLWLLRLGNGTEIHKFIKM